MDGVVANFDKRMRELLKPYFPDDNFSDMYDCLLNLFLNNRKFCGALYRTTIVGHS